MISDNLLKVCFVYVTAYYTRPFFGPCDFIWVCDVEPCPSPTFCFVCGLWLLAELCLRLRASKQSEAVWFVWSVLTVGLELRLRPRASKQSEAAALVCVECMTLGLELCH